MSSVPGHGDAQPGARDLADYAVQYRALPFEPVQIGYRRRRVLHQVRAAEPRRLLEIGCGERPLFTDLPGVACVVVEPTRPFADGARRLAAGRAEVTVLEALMEEVTDDALGGPFDVVVLSCLLHEVPDPQRLLAAARRACAPGALLHVTVPNARSLHRMLAVAMGLIPEPATESETQRTMQQRGVYDAAGLDAELARAGFTVRRRGTLFVKPFTHSQMQQLLDQGFATPALLDGLDRLAVLMPELGSELWVDAEPTGAGAEPTGA